MTTGNERARILVLDGLPPTVNTAWCVYKGRRILTKKYREYKERIAVELFGQKIPDDWPFVYVRIFLAPTNKRSIDVDNRTKTFFDALTHAGFWRDDSIVAGVNQEFVHPEKGGRTYVYFKRLEQRDGRVPDMFKRYLESKTQ